MSERNFPPNPGMNFNIHNAEEFTNFSCSLALAELRLHVYKIFRLLLLFSFSYLLCAPLYFHHHRRGDGSEFNNLALLFCNLISRTTFTTRVGSRGERKVKKFLSRPTSPVLG
jgi:hypothetical protein